VNAAADLLSLLPGAAASLLTAPHRRLTLTHLSSPNIFDKAALLTFFEQKRIFFTATQH
jgi:hypothetical protein